MLYTISAIEMLGWDERYQLDIAVLLRPGLESPIQSHRIM